MYAHSYLTVNGKLSSSNGASDSCRKQAGNLIVLLVPVSAATQVCCSLPGTRACERSGVWSERGAERAKYSRSAERVFIQRPERSLCLAPVPLRYRSHHESRACTNPPRIHLCLQQLTKLSAYTSKIVRCEEEMEFVKYFQKQTDRSYRCTIPVKKLDDNDVEHEQECGDTIAVSKDSYFNLKDTSCGNMTVCCANMRRPEQNVSILNMVEIGNIG